MYHSSIFNHLLTASIVANAVGPWVASYNTYVSGTVTSKADTPIWILVAAGLLLGLGFWCMYHFSIQPRNPTNSSRSLRLPRHALARQQDHTSFAYTWICHGTWRRYHSLARQSSWFASLDHAMPDGCNHWCRAVQL
jgi:ABC-type nickel/cobalt efflux system permease component RcnA